MKHVAGRRAGGVGGDGHGRRLQVRARVESSGIRRPSAAPGAGCRRRRRRGPARPREAPGERGRRAAPCASARRGRSTVSPCVNGVRRHEARAVALRVGHQPSRVSAAARALDRDAARAAPAGTPSRLICVAAEASRARAPGETVTREPASAAETFRRGGAQRGETVGSRRTCSRWRSRRRRRAASARTIATTAAREQQRASRRRAPGAQQRRGGALTP